MSGGIVFMSQWQRAGELRPGDRVKVPGGSRTHFANIATAHEDPAPFRTVERTQFGCFFANGEVADPDPDDLWISVWFEDGHFGSYRASWYVLYEEPTGRGVAD